MDTTFAPKRTLFTETKEDVANLSKDAGTALDILQYPDPKLSEVSEPVISDIPTDVTLQRLLNDMVATLKSSRAVGLAAIQVGVPVRVLVVVDGDNILKVINPHVIELSDEEERTKEGCLSFLGLFINVKRPKDVVVEYFDEKGVKHKTANDGLLGRAIQHEIDHLNGLTFLDRLSNLERSQALQKNKIAKRRVKAVVKKISRGAGR